MSVKFSDSVKYIGVDDTTIDLFESQYVVPKGVSYNSYVILDEKVAVMDTIDERKTDEWFANLENVLNGRTVDYLVISHLEPDHAANIKRAADKFPQAQLVLSAKAKAMLPQFFDIAHLEERCLVVKEGDTLDLGTHKLHFGTLAGSYGGIRRDGKNSFLRRRIRKIRCIERRRRVDRRGEKILYQYRWKIRCAGSDTAQKSGSVRHSDDLPAAWTGFERKSRFLYRKVSYMEQL